MTDHNTTLQYAKEMDQKDPLANYREQFYFPKTDNGDDVHYFLGHSLGLQPKSAKGYIEEELQAWATRGAKGHFQGEHPWVSYHELLKESTARLVGALPAEVVTMNSLTVNLHLMLTSFYRPTKQRYKILIEAGAFPSDMYAVKSQIRLHGFNPEETLIEVQPRDGQKIISFENIVETIEQQGDEIALILFPGVQFRTGQLFPLEKITQLGHAKGIIVGFDLAHAVGNVPLALHDWGVDFAVWCTYKYLNAGPGAVGASFINLKHHDDQCQRLEGWWGNDSTTRFSMLPDFTPAAGADAWQLSNLPILQSAALRATMAIFDEVGMDALRRKSELLTGYLEHLLKQLPEDFVIITTPSEPEQRGCQLSLQVDFSKLKFTGPELVQELQNQGIYCDFRTPNVVRVSPVPLYSRFEDLYQFVDVFQCFCE